ncbi:hypothetical protein MH117_03025 [Paenibacillus sp. ACRRX]|uniref:hypothetical protein n=1 Tax=Paenibacillus sp. ACRRX TaxID=2918206 RepID=UPI001EF641A7|nr:hypothetical protein [Paenibacillus sp. ACRRX]MCG7406375.1 hypothetical protein [Paenibacillus sp. ACRRX]
MAAPATTGSLKTTVADMKIGDYITITYTGLVYSFGVNTAGLKERDIKGETDPMTGSYWYGIKVDKGFIISDRVVQTRISWGTCNANKQIEGAEMNDRGFSYVARSLSGGCAFADADGNPTLKQIDIKYGAFPTTNEYDTYIKRYPSYLIKYGNTIDDVFHYNAEYTLTTDASITGNYLYLNGKSMDGHNRRIRRGIEQGDFGDVFPYGINDAAYTGLRPVFQYKE